MFIRLDKEAYSSGETIKGTVFFENFNVSYCTKLMIKVQGVEQLPSGTLQ